jgi:hypothetical protein
VILEGDDDQLNWRRRDSSVVRLSTHEHDDTPCHGTCALLILRNFIPLQSLTSKKENSEGRKKRIQDEVWEKIAHQGKQ